MSAECVNYKYYGISASEHSIAEGRIDLQTAHSDYVQTLGGTALLSEHGEPRATMSFISFKTPPEATNRRFEKSEPLVFVMNGGPSSPASLWNAQALIGPYYMHHQRDGHLAEPDYAINYASPIWENAEVVHIDPIGTGLGRVVEGVEPTWAFNSTTDAEAASALSAWYTQTFSEQSERLIFLVGSSFAARRMPLVALDLEKRGIRVSGMAIISGDYDASMKDYANRKHPKSFVNCLPAMAVTARYHGRSGMKDYLTDDQLFDVALDFAVHDYAYNLVEDYIPRTERQALIRELAAFIGLSPQIIDAHDLRISPEVFAAQLLADEGKVISQIDSRLAFPAGQEVEIDPALDRWHEAYRETHLRGETAKGFPDIFRGAYQGIIEPEWTDNGLVADRRAKTAMCQILERNPRMAIRAVNGYYDLNTPAPTTDIFWQEMYDEMGVAFRRGRLHNLENQIWDHDLYLQKSGVDSYILPIGHQLVSPYETGIRGMVVDIIAKMCSMRAPYKEGCHD